MTDDRSAKKAARARMAETGEPYSAARRAVRTRPDHPAPLARPPAIDPREHAVYSRHWGVRACYLVRYEDRYSAWVTSAALREGDQAFAVPSEEAGRVFVDGWLATSLLRIPWGDRIAHAFLPSPDTGNGILYHAALVQVEDDGFWVACFDDTAGDGGTLTMAQFGEVGPALEQFAAWAESAAGRLDRGRAIGRADLLAAVLRYRAATVRASVAQASLGEVIRRHRPQADGSDGLHPLWSEAKLSDEALGRVLAGQEWTWPQQPIARPPGARLADTSVTTLATHVVDGQRLDLVSYQDTAGGRCLAIDRDGRREGGACDFQVDGQRLASAAMMMLGPRGQGMTVIYGRVHASVTALYAVMKDGDRVDWPIYEDARNTERYFAVIADCQALADVVATAPTASTSLQRFFGMWFSPPPQRSSRRRS